MKRILGASIALGLALLFIDSRPATADVIINNVLSPFTTIQVGPGTRRIYSASPFGYHPPHVYTRCYRRWDPWWSEWRMHCHRRYYPVGGYDGRYHGGYYGDYYGAYY